MPKLHLSVTAFFCFAVVSPLVGFQADPDHAADHDPGRANHDPNLAKPDEKNDIRLQDNADRDQSRLDEIKIAQGLVNEALYHELYGRNDERNQLLDKAAEIDSGNAQVNWQRGLLYHQNRWMSIDEFAAANKGNAKLAQYQSLREKTTDNEQDNLNMAVWCEQNELPNQRRAHLLRVLQLNPNNQLAREQMGFVQVNGRWLNEDEIENLLMRFTLDMRRLDAWKEQLLPIQRDLFGKSDFKREEALQQLLKIDDPSAVLPIELMFCGVSDGIDRQLIDHFDQMNCADATEAVSRIAVYHPTAELRTLAAKVLKKRDAFQYVPNLLATMQTPIIGRYEVLPDSRGQIIYRHVFVQQLQDQNIVAESNRVYRRVRLPGGRRAKSRKSALLDVAININNNTIVQNAQDLQISQLNERVCQVLRIATTEKIGDDPRVWWQWWNEQNEVYYASTKPTSINRRTQLIRIFDKPEIGYTGSGDTGSSGSNTSDSPTSSSSGGSTQAGTARTAATAPPSTPPASTGPSLQPTSEPPRSSEPPRNSEPPRSSGGESNPESSPPEFPTSPLSGVSPQESVVTTTLPITGGTNMECLVAGTLVETQFGPKPIEKIRIGDMVLAKSISTGELAYEVVLDTTIRPVGKVFAIELQNETITCSGGHPFWVSGSGWVKARELKSGMPLHTVNGVVNVSAVYENGTEETFNLVVAQHHNYVVGKSRILSHDNTLRASTQVMVPGFISQFE